MLPRCPVLTNVLNDSKYWPTLMETVGLRVPNRNFRDFCFFNVDFKRLNCPPSLALRRLPIYSIDVRSWLI